MRHVTTAISIAAVLCGCASLATHSSKVTVEPAPNTQASHVQVLAGAPDKPYQKLALVSGYSFGGLSGAEDAALAELKRQAASAGADAVVDIRRATLTDQGVRYSAWYPLENRQRAQPEKAAPAASPDYLERARGLVALLFQGEAVLLRGEAVKYR